MQQAFNVQEELLNIINQLFQINQKVARLTEPNSLRRNLDLIEEQFASLGLRVENPLGQKYDETRTDCEASIAGESVENLEITEVLKPIVRVSKDGTSFIVQRAVVIVESSK